MRRYTFCTIVVDTSTNDTLNDSDALSNTTHHSQTFGNQASALSNQTSAASACGHGSWNDTNIKPFVYLVPFWIRFVQCVATAVADPLKRQSQGINALKYFVSMVVVLSSAAIRWFPAPKYRHGLWALWLAAITTKTVFCFYWDLVHDWQLDFPTALQKRFGGRLKLHRHPRPNIFPLWVYRFAAVANLFGRMSWSLAISNHVCTNACRLSLAMVEIVRRCGWLVLRLEAPWAVRAQGIAFAAKYTVGDAGPAKCTGSAAGAAAMTGVFEFTRARLPHETHGNTGASLGRVVLEGSDDEMILLAPLDVGHPALARTATRAEAFELLDIMP